MNFLLKAITVWCEEKVGFDYKNNQKYNKLANFQLNTIN